MDITYVKRQIKLSEFLDKPLPDDIQKLVDYFKELTYRYEKDENRIETWFDENGQWTIQNKENWVYSSFFYNNWSFLEEKYSLNYDQTKDLIHGMLELTLNCKVKTPVKQNLRKSICWS